MEPKPDNWQALERARGEPWKMQTLFSQSVSQFSSVVQFYYACVVSPVLFRLCCFACVVSPVLFRRFGVGVVVVVVVVIIAFTLMPFAMFETSDRYLTQKLIMASKNAINSERIFQTLQKA